MHVVMKFITTIAKMYTSLMYQSLLHRCLGFSFISIQDYGRQNLTFLAKIFLLGLFVMVSFQHQSLESGMIYINMYCSTSHSAQLLQHISFGKVVDGDPAHGILCFIDHFNKCQEECYYPSWSFVWMSSMSA